MAGKFDPLSDEGIGRAFEFASTFSPARAVNKIPTPNVERPSWLGRRVLEKPEDTAAIRARVEDARGVGFEPTAGMANGNRLTATKEQVLATTNTRGIQDRIDGAFGAMDNEFGRIVDGLTQGRGASTRQELGEMLQEQARNAAEGVRARSRDLYDETGRLTQGVKASGDNIAAELEKLKGQKKLLGKSAALNSGKAYDDAIKQAAAIVDDVKAGASFDTLKDARTAIGNIVNARDVDPNVKARLDGIYKALTNDMEATAKAGGEDALQAYRKANNHYRRNYNKNSDGSLDKSITPMVNKATPEQVYDFTMQHAAKGGSRLSAVRRQIEKAGGSDEWNQLAGSVVDRMGREMTTDGLGAFNPTRMLKQWNSLAPEAKDALFKGTDRAQYRKDLDRLARVADNMKAYRRSDNHSNTAKHGTVSSQLNPFTKDNLLYGAIGGAADLAVGGGTGITGAISGMAMGKAAQAVNNRFRGYQAELLQDPKVVNWLADIPKAEVQKGGLRKHVEQLARYAKTARRRGVISAYLQDIGYEEDEQNQ